VQYGKPEVRRAVMRALSAIAQPEDKERLIEVFLNALFDQDVQVKLIVIEGLRPIRDQRVVTGLSGAVIDPNVEVQKAAITALAETKDANAMEGIARALFADSKEVKLLAIDALGQLGQENAVKPLREFIKNETDEELRKRATEVHDMF
jgi:HEAT repeat protein